MWKHQFTNDERQRIVDLSKNSLFNKEGEKALSYLLNIRKFSIPTIKVFDVGYCPETAPHQLRGRLITPIYDYKSNIISISTRHLDPNHSMRFWHERFAKKFHIYGLNVSKDFIIKKGKVVIVEGEFDALALHSFGFKNVVALCSKNLSLSQVGILARYTNKFIFLLDGDAAGKQGVLSAKKMWENNYLKEQGLDLFTASLPDGHDPNDFLKKYPATDLQKILIECQINEEF